MIVTPWKTTVARPAKKGVGRRLLVLAAPAALGVGAALSSNAGPALAAARVAAGSAPSAAAIVATAERYLGYPYADTGDDPSTGFSCIGFVHFVFAQNGVEVPDDLASAYASAPHVDQSQLQPGDLVFFQNTVWNGISHVDLYIGGGKMIGADSYQTGVQWDTLSDAYWQQHYLGATRPLANLADSSAPAAPIMTPLSPTATPLLTATPSDTSIMPVAASPSPTAPVADTTSFMLYPGMTVTPSHDATIYSGPDDEAMTIDVATPEMPLTVVRARGPWVDVSYAGGTRYGWVHHDDLTPSGAAQSTNDAGQPGPESSTATPTSTPDAARTGPGSAGMTLVVQSADVPVYDRPSPDSAVLATITTGTDVSVLRAFGLWDQIALPDATVGWIEGAALSPAPAPNQGTAAPEPRHRRNAAGARGGAGSGFNPTPTAGDSSTVVVTADVLFVRDNADYHARILRRVHAGDRLTVLTSYNGWDYVALRDGSRGWVSTQWVAPAPAA